ncbi:acetolactate synthase-1/2/3 large subunit [Thermosporothrix hazakensis]|jgi:acetolactate synthase-1/2/3 large subunit|uniref:2-hydroxy-4-methyl-2-(2-phenylacetyl)pentanoic acid synthase n=1 Tax=Thermosporothrix hazakensis TaxID=644383 RepID=X5IXP5_THEHA|nr:thiamine pyrophosphate-binding protein [Thermosporothrix hazakensis]PZW22529.1 acetolactate synthase-1/2/3 large subunit [Thermosporothrix hazakensis]BAO66169.1 2-hydroxy-4-methyl-2-(2-phenylacetyl)pentanoic acid synthase [Thermosporothrix hazakensis]GCE50217.1 acetolactate synthase, large subunit, biosynthetic type [Thermosporothrix hazakensis]
MSTYSAIEVLLRALEEEGVTHLFGVPGGPLVPLYETLARRKKIRPVLAKHEEGAAFMAEGYARVRRGLGVCCGTSGPGATNALTGVASAYSDSIPVLFLSAQVSTTTFGKGALQDSSGGNWNLDIVDIFRSATKLSTMLSNAQHMPHVIRRAIRTALTGRQGAVHLNLPADLVKQPVTIEQIDTAHHRTHTTAVGDPEAIARISQILQSARTPAFFVGHGVNLSGAWEPLRQIAELLQIPVATTIKGKSAFPEDHPLSLGVFGLGGSEYSDAYMLSEEVDVLVIVGTSLGEFQTHGWDARLARNRTVIQIDLDPLEIGKNYPVDESVVGDARAVLQKLYEHLRSAGVEARHSNALLYRIKQEYPRYYNSEELQGDAALLKPQAVVSRMSELLPSDTLLFVDNGNCLSWIGQYYVARQPGTMFMALNVASMGYAMAAPIGGKIAAPDRPVVALVGDGAFAMNGLEMHTAVDYGVPVVWVVLNNGGHGMVYNGEKMLCGESFATVFHHQMDIATIARGLGLRSYKATTLDELSESLQDALEAQVPCLIDAMVDINEVPYALQRRVNTLQAFFGKSELQPAH